MKRQQLRQQQRQLNKPMTLTYLELQRIKENMKKDALNTSLEIVLSSVIVALAEEHGYGMKRIDKLVQAMNANMKGIVDNKHSLNDLLDKCKKTGMDYDLAFGRSL